jgi:hypothetical protein
MRGLEVDGVSYQRRAASGPRSHSTVLIPIPMICGPKDRLSRCAGQTAQDRLLATVHERECQKTTSVTAAMKLPNVKAL